MYLDEPSLGWHLPRIASITTVWLGIMETQIVFAVEFDMLIKMKMC